MKSEHLKIQTLFNLLAEVKDDAQFSELYLTLRQQCKEHSVRFEIYYEKEYYQSMILDCQVWIEDYVKEQNFELAARMRDTKHNHERMIREIDLFFGSWEAPVFIVDEYGFCRCFLAFKDHQKLILTVLSLA